MEDGQEFTLSYVADENGYQPSSPFLPELPDFVKEQVEFAKQQQKDESGGGVSGGSTAGGSGGTGNGVGSSSTGGFNAGGYDLRPPGQTYLTPRG